MANTCSFVNSNQNGSNAAWNWYTAANPKWNSADPFYFDANTYGIKCLAFPSNGDTTTIFGLNQQITNLATAIANLQTQTTSLQQQVDALAGGSITQAPNPEIIQAMALIFGASLIAAVAVHGLKSVYNLFRSRHDAE